MNSDRSMTGIDPNRQCRLSFLDTEMMLVTTAYDISG